jgi:lipopolysaccharide/colanic/teichoic acid biosynthesis glycosyltransferase
MRGQAGIALGAKRALDVVGAAAGLLLLSPALAAIALAVLATQGRPVLFRQVRPGFREKLFTIVKFRTMRPLRADEVSYFSDRQRVTALGRFLRSTSLDELPELWNVLRGEMSLVGPRPLLVEYLQKYTPEQRRRHDVLPGITGWAAVNGRHTAKFGDRLALDVWYVDHWSLWLDLKILALTVVQVLRRSDVAEAQDIAEIGFPLEADRGGAARQAREGGAERAPEAGLGEGRPGGEGT